MRNINSNFIKHYHLYYTPLSPMHIGCNETYEPTNYVMDDNALYAFDTQNIYSSFSESEKDEFSTMVSGKVDANLLKRVQMFFYKKRKIIRAKSKHTIPICDGVANLYRSRIGQTAQREADGKSVFNKLEIERTSYNRADNRPMFPGSSIKGAIRTALLDKVNNGKPRQHFKEKNYQLQQRLFKYSGQEIHKDPMRLLSISDAIWQNNDDLPGSEVIFAVNRKQNPVSKDGRSIQSMAEEKGLHQSLECISPFRCPALTGTITLQNTDSLGNNYNSLLPANSLRWSIEEISQACNDFYLPIFIKEIGLLHHHQYLDSKWYRVISDLMEKRLTKEIEENRVALLRIGRHSGAESVTLNGVRQIKIMQGFKKQPKYKDKPQTIWLASPSRDEQAKMVPFGWVLVEFGDSNQCEPIFDPQYFKDYIDKSIKWQKIQEQKKVAGLEEEKKREQAQKEILEQKEREQQKKAEQKRQLAQMTPLQREILEICEKEQNPPSILFNKLDAGHWTSSDDQQIVAKKIKELWQIQGIWNPDFSGKNKNKLKKKKRCLKVLKYLGG